MPRNGHRDLPPGITLKVRKQNGTSVPVTTPAGAQVCRVRLWDPVLKRQIERTAEGLDAAKQLLTASMKQSGDRGACKPNTSGPWTSRSGIWSRTGLSGTARRVPNRRSPRNARA